jgi:hypothetical protein
MKSRFSPRFPAFLTATLSLGLFLSGVGLSAQSVEFGLAFNWSIPELHSTYVHSYTPPFTSYPYTASGNQTLTLDAGTGLGLGFVFTLFMRERTALQFSYTPFRTDILGYSTDLLTTLHYTIGTPPTAVDKSWQEPLSGISGTLHENAFNIDFLYRIGSSQGLCVDLTAGVSYIRFNGNVRGVGYTRFWLNADNSLGAEDYLLNVEFAKKGLVGGNAGATLNLVFNGNFGLFLEGRYFLAPDTKADVSLAYLVSGNPGATPIDPVKQMIPLAELLVNTSLLRLGAGFKIIF